MGEEVVKAQRRKMQQGTISTTKQMRNSFHHMHDTRLIIRVSKQRGS
jgi:hypothetical protein